MTREEQEELWSDFESQARVQTEQCKDFEDAMSYLDSEGVPAASSLTARIIMYKDMIRSRL